MGILLRSPQSGGILEPSDLRNPSLASYLRTLAGKYQSTSCCLCCVSKLSNKTSLSQKVLRFLSMCNRPCIVRV